MAKIFISYSSKDRAFVERFALDLLSNGLPIWLDSWEIQLADSLYDKIYRGLESSSYVIVIISNNYNKSLWTSKEFKGTLSKEEREKRSIIIPILIDDSINDIPLEIADRIYKNIKENYDQKITELVRFFKQHDVTIKSISTFERLIPLTFDNYIHLNTSIIKTVLKDRNHSDSTKFVKNQIWIRGLNVIDELVIKAKFEMKVKEFDHLIITQFRDDIMRIEALIDNISEGIITILNEYRMNAGIDSITISIYWFCKNIMETIFSILSRYVNIENELGIKNITITNRPFSSDIGFCKFYNIDGCKKLALVNSDNRSEYISFFVDSNNYVPRKLDEFNFPLSATEFWNEDLIYKYLIPQNVAAFLINRKEKKILADFNSYIMLLD